MTSSPEMGLVSIVIPAYNAAWCIERAVQSVLDQTYRPIEVIVVNDGSTDDTVPVLQRFGQAIRIVDKPNGGLSFARNAGISAARGEYIAFLDADDWWLPEKLARQVDLLESDPSIGFCSTTTKAVDETGNLVREWRCPPIQRSALHTIFSRNATVAGSGSSVMVRSEVLQRAGFFDESLRSLEDIDMWMRLASISGYRCLDEPLTVILKRRESMSGNLAVMREAALLVMRKNRHLLDPKSRGRFWNACYATVLADYAKWECREGYRGRAILHLCEGLLRAPLARGRLLAGLLLGVFRGKL